MRGVDRIFDGVVFEPIADAVGTDDGVPFATHQGMLKLGAMDLRVYQLNTGVRVVDADDLAAFLGAHPGGQDAD